MWSNQQQRSWGGGGSQYVFDPRIGGGALPPGIQGTANRAYTRQVQPDELSGNQITGLLSQANPYIANARQRGMEQAASRGLLNSSASAGAAERSAIEAAAPLALQQAGAFGTAAGQNLDALNQMGLAQLQAASANQTAGMAANAAIEQANIGRLGALERQRENLAFSGEQSQLGRQHDWGMAQMGTGMQDWLANRNMDRAMQSSAYGMGLGLYGQAVGNMLDLPNRMFQSGMIGPDYFANPSELSNFFGGFYSAYQPMMSTVFADLFRDFGI